MGVQRQFRANVWMTYKEKGNLIYLLCEIQLPSNIL